MNTDATTKLYVDNRTQPALTYNTTITTLTNGAVFDVVHNLGLNLNQLDIACYFVLKVAKLGFSIGQYLNIENWMSDMSSNGKSEGVSFTNIGPNQFRIICGGYGVSNARRTGGTSDNSTMIDFSDVDL